MPGGYVQCDYCRKERDLEIRFGTHLTQAAKDDGWSELGNGPMFDRLHFCCDEHRSWFIAWENNKTRGNNLNGDL